MPNTAYTLYAREKATQTHEAGEAVNGRFTTAMTTAPVYHVIQNADGTYLEPAGMSDAIASMTYAVPQAVIDSDEADPVTVKASGYTFDTFETDESKWNPVWEETNIALPARTKALYVYYARESYDLRIYGDIAGEGEPVQCVKVICGAPVSSYTDAASEAYAQLLEKAAREG